MIKGAAVVPINLSVLSGLLAIIATAITGAPAQSYEVGAVTGGGTIEGVVLYRGDVPTKTIIPTKNLETCGGLSLIHI